MKIKKFNEKYELDLDYGDISEEYCKVIISTYLDKKSEETLESVFAEIAKRDNLEEDQEYIIKNTLQDYLYNLFEEAKEIRTLQQIEQNKYNL